MGVSFLPARLVPPRAVRVPPSRWVKGLGRWQERDVNLEESPLAGHRVPPQLAPGLLHNAGGAGSPSPDPRPACLPQ